MENMTVEIGKVISVRKIRHIYDMVIYCPEIAKACKAGQIVNVKCEGFTLRRPISICESDTRMGNIRLCFEVKGGGTAYMASLGEGSAIDLLGPLGKGYDIDALGDNPLLCGGGIGTFPLYFTAKSLIAKGIIPTVALAFRTEELVIMKEDFEQLGCKVFVSTDDGSCGFTGYAVQLCENLFENESFTSLSVCGPLMMMKTVCPVAIEKNIPCFASLEERMGCGVGACLACVCDIKDENAPGGFHRERVCAEGPVFDASTVMWDKV